MVGACAAAFVVPFHLFLFAYAVLGPLHYLTQISWLHDRGYFTKRRTDALILGGLTALAVVSPFTASNPVEGLQRSAPVVCVALVGALVMAFSTSGLVRVAVVLAGIVTATGVVSLTAILLLGYFLTTLIHVFVFTAMFILVGSLKTRSASGLVSLGVLLVSAAACLLAPVGRPESPGPYLLTAYGPFGSLIAQLVAVLGWLGWRPLRTMDDIFLSSSGVAATRFIAFAYTYHYLNWFSKTKVIGWHEIPRRRAVAILGGWALAVGCYALDYRFGFLVLLGLSQLHVVLEFPLDNIVGVDIGRKLGAIFRPATALSAPVPARGPREPRTGRRSHRR
jgi:hypothetical protein